MATEGQARRSATRGSAHRGQALLWVALLLPVFLSIVGLALDGGIVFAARRQAQNAADAAARAGAQEIDLARYRDTGEVVLDAVWSRYEARRYVAGLGSPDSTVDIAGNQVFVTVRRDVPLSFLRLVGVASVRIDASAVAAPFYGIDEGRRQTSPTRGHSQGIGRGRDRGRPPDREETRGPVTIGGRLASPVDIGGESRYHFEWDERAGSGDTVAIETAGGSASGKGGLWRIVGRVEAGTWAAGGRLAPWMLRLPDGGGRPTRAAATWWSS